ncbi:MAG: branched-chain amino acid ABC transporter permease [Spirulinaceae cyanobacterium SM2_1_0]|nr:branched-chain amino acid ABC transporter permease [Spirulinaceae cyanobacterium SM2_1_0]
MLPLLQGLFNGVSIGSVLLIAALGLAIVFGLMGVINLAHGELMMLGAYSTFVVQNGFKILGEPWSSIYIFAALPVAFIVAALVGLALERGAIRFLYGRPLETLLATWGVSLILRQFVRSANWPLLAGLSLLVVLFFGAWVILTRVLSPEQWRSRRLVLLLTNLGVSLGLAITTAALLWQTLPDDWVRPWFGPRNVDVTAPAWLRGGIPIGTFQLPYARIFIIVLTVLCLVGMYWFLNASSWGLRIRAVTQNRDMSACLGIDTGRVDALTFALGSGLAGVAGVAIALLGSVGPNTGQNYIVDTFMVVVVGGVGNLLGTIIAALVIGSFTFIIGSGAIALLLSNAEAPAALVEFFNFFATTSMAKVMVFAAIIAFLQFRPAGIFPPKGRTAEL